MASKTVTTPKNKAKVLKLIGEGLSVKEICEQDGMPSRDTVYRWIADDADFADNYARATTLRADTMFDEMEEIADNANNDWMERRDADGDTTVGWQLNGEHIQRSKLRVDVRKWKLSKMQPKKYGEKLDIEHGGSVTVVHRTFHQPMPKDK